MWGRPERHRGLPADAWCWLYFVSSPLIAGAIFWFGVDSTRGGGDYCDSSYGSRAERDADFHSASLSIDIGSLVMLAVGVAAAAVLLVRRQRGRGLRVALSLVATAVAMGGYLFLFLIGSDFSSDCGDVRL